MNMSDLDELRAVMPAGTVVTDPDIVGPYSSDRADLVRPGLASALVRPTTTEQVQAAVRWAHDKNVPIVPRGAGTGLSGGANAIDGCLLISLEKMREIREIDSTDQVAVVEAGVVNADVSRAALSSRLFYPPDPGSFEISTIGGNVATNAGGMRCVKYGVTRASVLGLEVVLADGTVLRTGGRTVKNVVGLDLTQLMVGSEGTLGIITAATLRLRSMPAAPPTTFVATFPTLEAAGAALTLIAKRGTTLSMLEIMDRNTINAVEDHQPMGLDRDAAATVIGQIDDLGSAADVDLIIADCERSRATLTYATDDPQEAELLLHSRRLAGVATMERGPSIIEDVAVPRSRLIDLMLAIEKIAADTGLQIATLAHAGDGNLHPILMLEDLSERSRQAAWQAADLICAETLARNGTISGEHGVGVLKQRWLPDQVDSASLDLQRKIKQAFDPRNIMNPGRGY